MCYTYYTIIRTCMGANIYLDLRENLLKGERLVDKCLNDPQVTVGQTNRITGLLCTYMYVHMYMTGPTY